MSSFFMSLWEDALVAEFGKRAKRHMVTIMNDILVVDDRLKPSYLWDLLQPCPQKIFNVMSLLHGKNALKTLLHVVVVGEDVFVVHLQELVMQVQKLLHESRETFLVDVSKTLDAPRLAENKAYSLLEVNLRKILAQLLLFQDKVAGEKVCSVTKKILFVELDDNLGISLSTIFGAFLGYPVVYYCKNSDGNCLSFCPLRIFSVALIGKDYGANCENRSASQVEGTHPHAMYTFSVPEILMDNVIDKINKWYSNLRDKLKHRLSAQFVMKQKTLTPSTVSL